LDEIKKLVATRDAEYNEHNAKLNEIKIEIEEMEKRKIELTKILNKKEEENSENAKKVEEHLAQEKEQRKNGLNNFLFLLLRQNCKFRSRISDA
jgi:chromosome segregation ATPase